MELINDEVSNRGLDDLGRIQIDFTGFDFDDVYYVANKMGYLIQVEGNSGKNIVQLSRKEGKFDVDDVIRDIYKIANGKECIINVDYDSYPRVIKLSSATTDTTIFDVMRNIKKLKFSKFPTDDEIKEGIRNAFGDYEFDGETEVAVEKTRTRPYDYAACIDTTGAAEISITIDWEHSKVEDVDIG
ncbi:hypothetical protein ACFHWD_03810 [Clostridium sp. MT-14]|uniref:hypothetical protein n=1 Tax=Clostridium sp. MT-14 TaxID=3348360 RepID=UPI0035F2CD81